jgi:hypothetical protein
MHFSLVVLLLTIASSSSTPGGIRARDLKSKNQGKKKDSAAYVPAPLQVLHPALIALRSFSLKM